MTPPQGMFSGSAYVERWQISRPGGLVGQSLRIDGIAGGVTDVIVRVERRTAPVRSNACCRRSAVHGQGATGTAEVAWSYLVLGVEHILGGVDHLLFVLALLLIVRGGKRILHHHRLYRRTQHHARRRDPGLGARARTAGRGDDRAEYRVRRRRDRAWPARQGGLTARAPWVVAFSFGLLHGFGFAGALAEVGLPQNAIPIALLMFNVGVELGS